MKKYGGREFDRRKNRGQERNGGCEGEEELKGSMERCSGREEEVGRDREGRRLRDKEQDETEEEGREGGRKGERWCDDVQHTVKETLCII